MRGDENAYKIIHALDGFNISVVTHIELVQGMRNKEELRILQKVLREWEVKTIYIDEEISAKALFFVENYFLSHSMQLADALIGATASSLGLKLLTANDKHYRVFKDVSIEIFRPQSKM
jgi:predicted nucleic acid-binding protein